MLGALLLAVSVCGLYISVPDLLQYTFLTGNIAEQATSGTEGASGTLSGTAGTASPVRTVLTQYRQLTDPALWGGEDIPMTLHGSLQNLSVSREDGGTSVSDISLQMAGPRFAEVFPREMKSGSFFSPLEISSASPVAVLDSALTFRLFGDQDPVGRTVLVEGTTFTVVGVAAHSRSLGSAREYTLWIPLGSISSLPETLTVSALPASGGDSLLSLWKSKAAELFGAGTFLYLPHEKMAASLLPMLLLFFFAVLLLKEWFSLLRRLGRGFLEDARKRLARSYPSRLIGYFILRILLALLLLAATLAVLWGLASLAIQPLMAFPDWVPENPADFSSWISRFWALVGINATPVRLVTEQSAIVGFWSFLIRLGTVLILLGLLSLLLRRRREKTEG